MSSNHVWIIGAGGLLGSALTLELSGDERFTMLPNQTITWADVNQVTQVFERSFQQLMIQAATAPWTVIWAAGHASTSNTRDETAQELETLQILIDVINQNGINGQGTFFLTSSVGGVYAGSQHPPFTIDTDPNPLSAYGELKLAQENLVKEQLTRTCRVVVGRISNLYGPGQDISKLQGVISQLAVSALTKKPLRIFVPLDTMRDYIYVEDAAKTIIRLLLCTSKTLSTHIVASGLSVSLGYVIQVAQVIFRTRIPLSVGSHSSAAAQARDLRITPTASPENFAATTLPVGIKNVYLDILHQRQEARPRSPGPAPARMGS